MKNIPIIDLSLLWSEKCLPETEIEIASQIGKALNEVGFMYLVNHKVPEKVVQKAFEQNKTFFSFPLETKLKYSKTAKQPHGFVRPGQELLHPNSVFELRECFDVTGHNRVYPDEIPDYKSVIEKFESCCNILMRKLLRLVGVSLKLEDPDYLIKCSSHLEKKHIDNNCDLRSIYYPAIPQHTEIPENTVRCAEHTDYEILTLLFQDDIGGLEVKTANGDWLPATPIPGSILVNTGDLLEFWTCGYFPATLHRVIIPTEEVRRRIPRYSFAYFYAPDDSTVVSPLKSQLVQPNTKYPTAGHKTAGEHIKERMRVAYQY